MAKKKADPDEAYKRSLRERVRHKVLRVVRMFNLKDSDCWPWNGKLNRQGYGKIWDKTAPGKEQLAHRVVYEATIGPLVPGVCLLHTCDNPACCNPTHLRPGSRTDNAADRDSRKRQVFGERHYATKLTTVQVQEIRARYSTGESTRELADAFKAERKHIWKIVTNKIRRDG